MFFKGFWLITNPKMDFGQACAEIKDTGAEKLWVSVESLPAEEIAKLVTITHQHHLEFHAWTVNNLVSRVKEVQEIIEQHPDWLAVSREGYNTRQKILWGRHSWWCPDNKNYLNFYLQRVQKKVAETGCDGLHLDFIRYPDIFSFQGRLAIPRDEVPEYSFCYCLNCRGKYMKETGIDPIDVPLDPNSPLYQQWTQWRYQVITETVRQIRKQIAPNLKLSAAVFPTPEIARKNVLQDWPAFADQLDHLCTMIYATKQWSRPITWVKEVTELGLKEMNPVRNKVSNGVKGKCQYYAGFGYPIEEMKPGELRLGIQSAKEAGADGVLIYHYPVSSKEQLTELKSANLEFSK